MEDTDYSYNLNDNRKPSDFLIRPKNFSDRDFEKLCALVDTFLLTEINIFNFLYEELYLKNNDNSLVDIINKLDYYPSTLSSNLKNLVKNNYIELLLVKDSQPKKIIVRFTKDGLEQIVLIRKLFLQCKNCKELYNYPVLKNGNEADEDFCSHNCRYKFEMEESVQRILKYGISRQEWENGDCPLIFDEELKESGLKCILQGNHDEIHYHAFQNVVREAYEKYPKVYAKIFNVNDEDNYDQSLWIKQN